MNGSLSFDKAWNWQSEAAVQVCKLSILCLTCRILPVCLVCVLRTLKRWSCVSVPFRESLREIMLGHGVQIVTNSTLNDWSFDRTWKIIVSKWNAIEGSLICLRLILAISNSLRFLSVFLGSHPVLTSLNGPPLIRTNPEQMRKITDSHQYSCWNY
jgi:hypothetical protein